MCDGAKALLNACCWTFTGHDTIEAYAEACMTDALPRTKIEIDVAHYLKNWSDSLKTEKKAVKKFYMFAIGQLILCRDQISAGKMIKALLLISLSKSAGEGAAHLKASVDFIKGLISIESSENKEIEEIIDSTFQEVDDDLTLKNVEAKVDSSEKRKSLLEDWALSMKKETDKILAEEEGDDLNPRLCPEFANRLLKQVKMIPLWSCIRRDAFGYGRMPPSSAPAESEFKIIKNQVLPKITRIDSAVENSCEIL